MIEGFLSLRLFFIINTFSYIKFREEFDKFDCDDFIDDFDETDVPILSLNPYFFPGLCYFYTPYLSINEDLLIKYSTDFLRFSIFYEFY